MGRDLNMTSDYFVNPYNFVSLEEECDKQSARATGNLTGKIICNLKTLTPMFIPSDEQTEDGIVDFFHYPSEKNLNNKSFRPIIPGSEIRGAIRSVFEAAFNGCLSQVNEGPDHSQSKTKKKNTLIEIIKENGGYEPCLCGGSICSACHLFGFVNGKESKASRVRFSDAESNIEIYRLEKMILPVLETPHPDTVEFYTKRVEGADSWTYNRKKQKGKSKGLKLDEIQIRGRKFYWHHKPIRSAWNGSKEEKVIVNPIGTHKEFSFVIYFERLTEKELAQLCNTLDINYSDEHAHKIGRAKPFGFGSAQIQIETIKIRNIDQKTGEFSLYIKERKDFFNNRIPEKSELLSLLEFQPELHGKPVSYPKIKVNSRGGSINEQASHQWFTQNKNNGKFDQLLPTVDEEISIETGRKHGKWLKVLRK